MILPESFNYKMQSICHGSNILKEVKEKLKGKGKDLPLVPTALRQMTGVSNRVIKTGAISPGFPGLTGIVSMTSMKEAAYNMEAKKPYDLTEESSKRGDEGATREARIAENDDINEDSNAGKVSGPSDDTENRVWTSLSEDD
jgi:hypothetical protein